MNNKEEKDCELDFIIQTLYNALKKKKDIKQEIEINGFAKFTINTKYYRGIIKIKENEEEN